MNHAVVIGGGAAGMLCAILLAEKGNKVTLIEHNDRLGKKLFITGKGRCNFTNDCTGEEFLNHVVSNPKFLFSALSEMDSRDTIRLFESFGMAVKVERGRRAFPESDHSADVIDALRDQMKKHRVRVLLNSEVLQILTRPLAEESGNDGSLEIRESDAGSIEEKNSRKRSGKMKRPGFRKKAYGVLYKDQAGRTTELLSDQVIVATGGLSYPSTGSTGDGFRFAKDEGLRVTNLLPSLVPLVCEEEYVRWMQGLSLKNVSLKITDGKKVLFDEFGELMFTHYGITGPLVLSASAVLGRHLEGKKLSASIDLKPAVTEDMLDERIVKLSLQYSNRDLKNVLGELYPAKMIPVMPIVAGVDPLTKMHDLTRANRMSLIRATKNFPMTITAFRGYNEAVVTKGGVSVREIDPKSMQAKAVRGLYFIGEVLDVDAYTGGYNLQIAWSTAAACARAISEECLNTQETERKVEEDAYSD